MKQNAPSAIVLLSGGMDSATLLYDVVKRLGYEEKRVMALGFDYNQTHKKELEYANQLAVGVGVGFMVLEVNLAQIARTPLTGHNDIPDEGDRAQHRTWVPARNAIFLSYAAGVAQTLGYKDIFYGANREDFKSYPDCRPEFVEFMGHALRAAYGVQGCYAPYTGLGKIAIVERGLELKVPYEKTWTCYRPHQEPCMTCDACVERHSAMYANRRDYYGYKKVE